MSANSIIINSYNCRSVKNSLNDVVNLCNKSHTVLLQEHWLPKQELSYLENIHKYFIVFNSSPVDLSAWHTSW